MARGSEEVAAPVVASSDLAPPAKRCRHTQHMCVEGQVMHASAEGSGEVIPVPPESLDPVLSAWEELHPQVEELRQTASERHDEWERLLQEAKSACSVSDECLGTQQMELAASRYGMEADRFCVLPPSIASLIPLSTHSREEELFMQELQSLADIMHAVRERLFSHIAAAKQSGDRERLRELGPRYADWHKTVKDMKNFDHKVSRRKYLAARRLTAYRSQQTMREVEPKLLQHVEASLDGYTKILDFYRLSDASRYSFGRVQEGPQHFTDIRRNVAVLEVWNDQEVSIFNEYAVSGVDGAGVKLDTSEPLPLVPREAEDGLGEVYCRDQDAEFKLCSSFLKDVVGLSRPDAGPATDWHGRAVLFSKKPLCASCHDVVHSQLLGLLPGLLLCVIVDEVVVPAGSSRLVTPDVPSVASAPELSQ